MVDFCVKKFILIKDDINYAKLIYVNCKTVGSRRKRKINRTIYTTHITVVFYNFSKLLSVVLTNNIKNCKRGPSASVFPNTTAGNRSFQINQRFR